MAGELLEFDFSESELIDDQEEEKVDEADSDPGWIAARNERDMRAKRDKVLLGITLCLFKGGTVRVL